MNHLEVLLKTFMAAIVVALASRVAILALFVVTAVGFFNPYVLIPLMVVGGACGIAGIIHHTYREAHKMQVQKQNIQELHSRGGKV